MTDHKFTDEEVIKALKHCASSTGGDACIGCPFNDYNACDERTLALETHALDLINRQKAEICALTSAVDNSTQEFLKLHDTYQEQKAEIESLKDMLIGKVTSLAASIEIAEGEARVKSYIRSQKSEAIKEFAERLKQTAYTHSTITGNQCHVVDVYEIDNLVKEMTGENTDES